MFKKLLTGLRQRKGDLALIEAVGEFVSELGGGAGFVMHEKVSVGIHFDAHVVPASETRPFITLVTSGMAQKAMRVPKGVRAPTHAELVLFLPADYPVERVNQEAEAHWPVKILRRVAAYPHQSKT